ncbi:MAG: hypothetical protein IH786_06845 [Proteobacteria bacterium]|nr:hypothetical protein [Pseudomonadota bacterium]
MTPADILIGLFTLLFLILAWLVLRWMASVTVNRRELRRRLNEPRTHGDEGGIPIVKGRIEALPR